MNQGLKRKLMFRKAGKRIPPLNKLPFIHKYTFFDLLLS